MGLKLNQGVIYKGVAYKSGETIKIDGCDVERFKALEVKDEPEYDDDLVLPASEGLPPLDTSPKKAKKNV